MAKFALFLPDGTPMDLPLNKQRITIGRRADNDVSLSNLAVSGEHAAVVTIFADSFLEDLGSTNGTLVNGKAITKHFLRDGDEVDIGRHKFLYCEDDRQRVDPRAPTVLARVAARDLGEQVDPARPFVRVLKPMQAASGGRAEESGAETALDATQPSHAKQPAKNRASATVTRVPERAPPGEPQPEPRAWLKVLVGADPGRMIPLVKDETTVGRAGVQVVSIIANGDSFRLKRVEGERPVSVNGRLVAGEDTPLNPGEIIELADARLEFQTAGASELRTSGT